MKIITKIINSIKGDHKFLSHQKFQIFSKNIMQFIQMYPYIV